jgi:putative membrane protein
MASRFGRSGNLDLQGLSVSRSESAVVATEEPKAAWIDSVSLALVYAVSIASLAGFATFSLHPSMLVRANVPAETYGRMLLLAPRLQIVLAVAALIIFLVRYAGTRWLGAFAAIYALSLGAELAGTTVGLPFGPYHYTDGLGFKAFAHVPALIPASWFMMGLPSYAIASRRFADNPPGRVALGSFILLSWDLALDPAMSFVTKYWVWSGEGQYYGMPLLNLLGWFVTGVAIMIAFDALRAARWTRGLPTRWLVAFYGANLLLPVGMNLAVGLWGAVIATGGALAVAWLIARVSRTTEVTA